MRAKKVLVVGASGQVGRSCMAAFGKAGWETVGTFHANPGPGLIPLDLWEPDALRTAVREIKPSVCIISSAFTNVDGCEEAPERARAMNTVAPGILAEACREVGARPVHLSTEYVFDGTQGPYAETDPVCPISVYGQTKLEGERAVVAAAPDVIVARTTVVYSHDPQGKNFVMQLISRLGRGESMRVPRDQVSSPTYAPGLGEALRCLVERGYTGIVNVVGPEVMDRFAFATLAARILGLREDLLEPVSTASLSQKAARPLQAGLKAERLRHAIGSILELPADGLGDVARRAGRPLTRDATTTTYRT